jgi:predicted nucleic acid-binding protein
MIVISDTSAITSLIQIGREAILPALFMKVIVPPAVRDELLAFHRQLPEFLQIAAPRSQNSIKELMVEVDRGEAEAIVLATELNPDFLLMDDLSGRRAAIRKGLPVIRLLGVLIEAKRVGVIRSLAEVIEELEATAGFRISGELRAEVLGTAGE